MQPATIRGATASILPRVRELSLADDHGGISRLGAAGGSVCGDVRRLLSILPKGFLSNPAVAQSAGAQHPAALLAIGLGHAHPCAAVAAGAGLRSLDVAQVFAGHARLRGGRTTPRAGAEAQHRAQRRLARPHPGSRPSGIRRQDASEAFCSEFRSWLSPSNIRDNRFHWPLLAIQQISVFLISTFIGPIYSTGLTLFYYDQRIRKEGYDIERMMQAAGLTLPAELAVRQQP